MTLGALLNCSLRPWGEVYGQRQHATYLSCMLAIAKGRGLGPTLWAPWLAPGSGPLQE